MPCLTSSNHQILQYSYAEAEIAIQRFEEKKQDMQLL